MAKNMRREAKLRVNLDVLTDLLGLPGRIKHISHDCWTPNEVHFYLEGDEFPETEECCMRCAPEIEISYTSGASYSASISGGSRVRAFIVNPWKLKDKPISRDC